MFANFTSVRHVRLLRWHLLNKSPWRFKARKCGRNHWGPRRADQEKWRAVWGLSPTTPYIVSCPENNPGNFHPNPMYFDEPSKWHPFLVKQWGIQDNYGYIDPIKKEFVEVPEMKPELVVPDLTGFKLKPYVSHRTVEPKDPEPELTAKSLFDKLYKEDVEKAFDRGLYEKQSSIFTTYAEGEKDSGRGNQ